MLTNRLDLVPRYLKQLMRNTIKTTPPTTMPTIPSVFGKS